MKILCPIRFFADFSVWEINQSIVVGKLFGYPWTFYIASPSLVELCFSSISSQEPKELKAEKWQVKAIIGRELSNSQKKKRRMHPQSD